MARITVDLRGLATLPQRVTTVLEAARSTRLKQELAAEALRQHQQRFNRREAPDGSKWQPRKDSKPHPLLQETGKLRHSIRATPERDAVAVRATRPVRGVDVAAVHQHGGGRVPQREFLGSAMTT